ncbi:hypothetical protein THERMOS_820 [Bathymodiolus thermophilus thioautotrophic gill symbiont]|uniref:Uncharacterized protein n=1 Tax=Bathymodiolus thermophilus thioautotrophic gill symbiont TaxID=2360 RepID=A0A8H9CGF8_9GAMM|nr:hypothetical protein THERMOS_820 [Bathymodiolus thermophilus thioautotrophic gill symbiont]
MNFANHPYLCKGLYIIHFIFENGIRISLPFILKLINM